MATNKPEKRNFMMNLSSFTNVLTGFEHGPPDLTTFLNFEVRKVRSRTRRGGREAIETPSRDSSLMVLDLRDSDLVVVYKKVGHKALVSGAAPVSYTHLTLPTKA